MKARNHSRAASRRSRPAKTSCINRTAAKSECAREWGGWGRISDDGLGHYNPDRSEGPWGEGNGDSLERWCAAKSLVPALNGMSSPVEEHTKDGSQPRSLKGMPGAGLTERFRGQTPSERPAFQPYRGKPAVRNERGDGGNVGIIRSPVRAAILPDKFMILRMPRCLKQPKAESAGPLCEVRWSRRSLQPGARFQRDSPGTWESLAVSPPGFVFLNGER
jgi:hypothetical protein